MKGNIKLSVLKKIVEVSTLFVLLCAIVFVDISVYSDKKSKAIAEKNSVLKKYELSQANIDDITIVTFDDFLVGKLNESIMEKNKKDYEEYQEYLKSLIVYDGLTMDQLAEKLDRSLKNELHGYGRLYAEYSLANGVDPYIAVAISLHETGCNGTCSRLMRECNNVGGQKGSPVCGEGGYRGFDTLEDGIKGFIDNLSRNYFGMGLNTPELMNSKYAASTTWAQQVNNYVATIRSR